MGRAGPVAPARAAGYVWQLVVEAEPEPMREPSGSTEGSAGVVLLVPEALGEPLDLVRLRATLAGRPRAARVLLCLTGNAGHELASALAELALDLQILLAADAAQPAIKGACLRAPPGMSPDDQTEFALALCDVVLIAPGSDHPVARLAAKLGKPVVAPGDRLPMLALEAFTHGLDPQSSSRRRINGRVEQWMVESLAFAWSGWTRAGCAESWKRLRRCLGPGWGPAPYFAPDAWRDLSPDRAAVDASAPIAATFDAMDRSALHGSYIHRDITWLTHFGAAFAVFAAVAGFVYRGYGVLWGILEIATLVAVAVAVYRARRSDLQERWTACRFAAEQLRIARMSLPLLVLPPALATADAPQPGHGDSAGQIEFRALVEVKRVVRDQGLPQLDSGFSPKQAAAWLHLIVSDQLEYHRRNHRKLEHAEERLRRLTQIIFAIAVIAVVAHLIELSPISHRHDEWLLLITAAGPALAAALHGAGTRLGIVHRAALSEEMERELRSINVSLERFLKEPSDTPESWQAVRGLAYEAANAMGRENTSWHGLVRRYRDELP
jgi:hypothetical protein